MDNADDIVRRHRRARNDSKEVVIAEKEEEEEEEEGGNQRGKTSDVRVGRRGGGGKREYKPVCSIYIYMYKRQIRKSVILRWPGGRFSGPGSRCDNIFILSRINFTGERRFNRNTAVTDRTNYKDRFAD